MALTLTEIVSLAAELKGLGVQRFAWDGLSFEFATPDPEALSESSEPPTAEPDDPVTRAAHRLANRAFRAA